MKDKQLQIRTDDKIEQMLVDLRREEPDVCGKSEMVRRLIERAHNQLKSKKR